MKNPCTLPLDNLLKLGRLLSLLKTLEKKNLPAAPHNYPDSGTKLTVLSFGAGQDSTALLYLYIKDQSFRRKYSREEFIVVMSDTGR